MSQVLAGLVVCGLLGLAGYGLVWMHLRITRR